ncbi:hypothetical protein EDD21DRAFT_349507 [Dissophora ornata]|nr:hypothetical protein EDD21DRAFT_349507 [Dissophora ornata]
MHESSAGKGGNWSLACVGEDQHGRKTGVQTVTYPGGQLYILWPAKNHAVPDEVSRPDMISMSLIANEKKDPTQQQFLGKDKRHPQYIFNLNYKNCTNKDLNTDIWPCVVASIYPRILLPATTSCKGGAGSRTRSFRALHFLR